MKNKEKMLLDHETESFFYKNKKYITIFLFLFLTASIAIPLSIILPNNNEESSSVENNNGNEVNNTSFPNASKTSFTYYDLGDTDSSSNLKSSYITINYNNWINDVEYTNVIIANVYIKDSNQNDIVSYDITSFDESGQIRLDVDEKNLFEYGKKYFVYISLLNSKANEKINQQISSTKGTQYINWTFNNAEERLIYPDNFGLRIEDDVTKILVDGYLFYGKNSKILDLSIHDWDTKNLIESQTEDDKTVIYSSPDDFYGAWEFEFNNLIQGKDYYLEMTYSVNNSSVTKESVPFTQKNNTIVDGIYSCSAAADLDTINYDKSNINTNLIGDKEFNINSKMTEYYQSFDGHGYPVDTYNVALPDFFMNSSVNTFSASKPSLINLNLSFLDMFENFINYTIPKNPFISSDIIGLIPGIPAKKSLQTCYNPDDETDNISYINMFDFNYFENFNNINNKDNIMKYWINNNYTIFNHTLSIDNATIRYPNGILNNTNGLSANKFEFNTPIQLEFGMTDENGDGKSFLINEVSKLYIQTSNYSTNITGQNVNLDITGLSSEGLFNYQTYKNQSGEPNYTIFNKDGSDIALNKTSGDKGIDGTKLTDKTPLIYNFYIIFDNTIRIEIKNANLTQITDVEHLNYWTINYMIV